MVFAIAHFSPDQQVMQQIVLRKHAADICVDLGDGIYISHMLSSIVGQDSLSRNRQDSLSSTKVARTPLTNCPAPSCPNFLASSTASLIMMPTGVFLSVCSS